MHIITDKQGRDYEIAINIATARRIRAKFDLDLMNPESLAGEIANAIQNVSWCLDLAFFLIKEQARKLLDPKNELQCEDDLEMAWLDSFDATQVTSVCKAIESEVLFFIQTVLPMRGQNTVNAIAKIMQKADKVRQMEAEAIADFVDDPSIEEMIRKDMDRAREEALKELSNTVFTKQQG